MGSFWCIQDIKFITLCLNKCEKFRCEKPWEFLKSPLFVFFSRLCTLKKYFFMNNSSSNRLKKSRHVNPAMVKVIPRCLTSKTKIWNLLRKKLWIWILGHTRNFLRDDFTRNLHFDERVCSFEHANAKLRLIYFWVISLSTNTSAHWPFLFVPLNMLVFKQ